MGWGYSSSCVSSGPFYSGLRSLILICASFYLSLPSGGVRITNFLSSFPRFSETLTSNNPPKIPNHKKQNIKQSPKTISMTTTTIATTTITINTTPTINNFTNQQAKDCINLLHLYLTKREIETRRVKNRSFAAVDIKELDLIPSFLL